MAQHYKDKIPDHCMVITFIMRSISHEDKEVKIDEVQEDNGDTAGTAYFPSAATNCTLMPVSTVSYHSLLR